MGHRLTSPNRLLNKPRIKAISYILQKLNLTPNTNKHKNETRYCIPCSLHNHINSSSSISWWHQWPSVQAIDPNDALLQPRLWWAQILDLRLQLLDPWWPTHVRSWPRPSCRRPRHSLQSIQRLFEMCPKTTRRSVHSRICPLSLWPQEWQRCLSRRRWFLWTITLRVWCHVCWTTRRQKRRLHRKVPHVLGWGRRLLLLGPTRRPVLSTTRHGSSRANMLPGRDPRWSLPPL